MYVDSAFALTPAAIISDANVWRASCNPIGSSPAASHLRDARFPGAMASGGSEARLAENEPFRSTGVEPVDDQVLAQRRNRHDAASRARLRCDVLTRLRVIRTFDTEHTCGEVDVFPPQGKQLTAPQAREERRRHVLVEEVDGDAECLCGLGLTKRQAVRVRPGVRQRSVGHACRVSQSGWLRGPSGQPAEGGGSS